MGKILNFFANVSFLCYTLKEHKITKKIADSAFTTVMDEKEKLIEIGNQLSQVVEQVSGGIAADKAEISKRPAVRSRAEFFDETGLTPAQLRAKQLGILTKVNHYNGLIDNEADNINQLNDLKNSWEARLSAKVVVKAKNVSPDTVRSICEQLHEVEPKDLSGALVKGCALQKIFTYNEAVIAANCLSSYNIKARVIECNAEENVKSMTKERDSEVELKVIAIKQRIFLSVCFFVLLGALIFLTGNFDFLSFLIPEIIGTALIFLAHWLLTKPILAVAWRFVNKSFKRNAEKLIDTTGYLRGVVLSETYEKGLDVLYSGLIDCINGYTENRQTVEKYASVFLPERVYAGLLPMVIEQMSIGAVFNDALYKTEATIDRRLAMQKQEERNARLEKETLRHNAEMEEQARRRADAEKQRAEAAKRAAEEIKDYTSAVRQNTREIKKIREDLKD